MCGISSENIIAIGTLLLVIATIAMAWRQIKYAKKGMFVSTLNIYLEKFDSQNMLWSRKKLADTLTTEHKQSDIKETVIDFFESLGLLLRRKALDTEMIWSSFGYHTIRWWVFCKEYIETERLLEKDKTIYNEFEFLYNKMIKMEAKKRKVKIESLKLTEEDKDVFIFFEKRLV